MLRYTRIEGAVDCSAALFAKAWEIYEYSFPCCERRTIEDQRLRMDDERYNFDVMLGSGGDVVGIICYWVFADGDGAEYIYLEHLATSRDLRSGGFGAHALEYLKSQGMAILLEIEPPEDELTRRRQGFYERSGFVLNEYHHKHTPYRSDTGDVVLRIMSYPFIFTHDRYSCFCQSQHGVMPRFGVV